MQNHLFEPKRFEYDVFISYAEDTRLGFTGWLKKSLADNGFSICKDDPEGFEKSRIVIVVFSKDYASSPSYLDELTKIIKFAKTNGILILPVFYHVRPADVRYQIGSYGEALAAHNNCVWIKAMKEGAGIVGWHIERCNNKFEFMYIKEILQEVSKHVARTVGLYTPVQEVVRCLDSKSDGVCAVVICGVSGIGKSTLVREVCNHNACNKFVYCCIVDKARECSSKHGFLSKIVGKNNIESEYDKGVLKQKENLIVEDINDLEQLKAIVEQTNLLASGSKVIITTTQDYNLLKIPGIDKIYEMKKFDITEANELLCLKMFNSRLVKGNSVGIIKRAVGLGFRFPFSLEVIGSTLAGKGKTECGFILDKYERIPNEEIREILKVSFNTLEERQQKMLIYIACHLKEKEWNVVEKKLRIAFGGYPREDMEVLLDKSLTKINEHGQVTVHDLTLDMVKDHSLGIF